MALCLSLPGIQQLQLILLKVALIVAVEFHINVEFIRLLEPPEDQTNQGTHSHLQFALILIRTENQQSDCAVNLFFGQVNVSGGSLFTFLLCCSCSTFKLVKQQGRFAWKFCSFPWHSLINMRETLADVLLSSCLAQRRKGHVTCFNSLKVIFYTIYTTCLLNYSILTRCLFHFCFG